MLTILNKYNKSMILESLQLPVFSDVETLDEKVRLTEKLVYYLTKEDAEGRYKEFSIPKKDGTTRDIAATCVSLKLMQRWVLENILYKVRVSQYSYGFKRGEKGSPLVRCAERHRNNLYILKMDLKNFYPSISKERIFKQFLQLGYNSYAANLLSNICTLHKRLPQGAVTSPYLANLVCYRMDKRIAGYCNKREITFTRYADDLTFSCDNRDSLRNVYGMIKKIVEDEGFLLNEKKTQFMTPKVHKKILGVTVNDGLLKASKHIKKNIRAMIHYQIITGDYSDNELIRGYIAYVNSIEENYHKKIIKYIEKFYNDPITLFRDAVQSFNDNKLYKELPDMKVNDVLHFVNYADEEDYLTMVYQERGDYLLKMGKELDEILK